MIDLKQTYGKRYKIGLDESFTVETWPGKTAEIAWYYELLGKYGTIYNHSDTHLQMTIGRKIGKRIYNSLPSEWSVFKDCSEGYAFSFPNGDIGRAFQYVKPRRKRIGNPNVPHLAKYHFLPKKDATQNTSGGEI